MIRFIILGISLLLGVSLYNHNTLLGQSPSKTERVQQEQLQSVIENEKDIVKNELNAIKNKANGIKKEPDTVGNETNAVKNNVNVVDNKTNAVKNQTNEKTRPTEQPQPVVANNANKQQQPKEQSQPVLANEENIVRNLVMDFGKKLQMVSLSAPQNTAAQSMRENYSNFISPTLLANWQSDPGRALGRLVSSPWPDRIEIGTVVKISATAYQVTGKIVEITSVEKMNGGSAAKRPVSLTVKKINTLWLIDEATAGQYETSQAVVYKNTQYGFAFSLPETWKGYTIVTDQWEGIPAGGVETVETGPEILIRHPLWTSQNPTQDIPIMIFTLAEWNALEQEQFHIGAAPIGPSELGRNNQYVFALPARYNYAFPAGYKEVEEILKGKPMQAFDITN
jgi:hypothetical protein